MCNGMPKNLKNPRNVSQGERISSTPDHFKLSSLTYKIRSPEEREDHDIFELGDFLLQSGRTIRNAKLAYK